MVNKGSVGGRIALIMSYLHILRNRMENRLRQGIRREYTVGLVVAVFFTSRLSTTKDPAPMLLDELFGVMMFEWG
jgi:hypothetical protein